jgi:hypothetical protein
MKKVCIALLLLLLCISPIIAAECGDVNGDGTIGIVDALLIAQRYVELPVDNFDPSVADVDGDNDIDMVIPPILLTFPMAYMM